MIPNIDFKIITEERRHHCSQCGAELASIRITCTHCFQEVVKQAASTWTNLEFKAEGGFAKVYKATWRQGRWECKPESNNSSVRYYRRGGPMEVALKEEKTPTRLSTEFLKEASAYLKCEYRFLSDNQLFGFSVNPETDQIILVMRYMSGGDLRRLLMEKPDLGWSDRLEQLASVMRDLQNIHKAGFVHKDFHCGNILWTRDEFQNYELCISDFGLSAASDIYAFGMVMWEFSSGKQPFHEYDPDFALLRSIISGLRPTPVEGTPDCYVDLMTRCWAAKPEDRPTSEEVHNELLTLMEMNDKVLPTFNDMIFEQFETADSLRSEIDNSEYVATYQRDRYISRSFNATRGFTVELDL
ncbi:8861_t:CDS:2 [Paraglomus occultum]|uniref:8861_t:CDS:1 n=1 Tax=Paraglomus occultum TaxID=144539 RepID=A0A9N9GKL7_9GLOM|nr:8861_t:CDS:2 [Paraglomus occultum]